MYQGMVSNMSPIKVLNHKYGMVPFQSNLIRPMSSIESLNHNGGYSSKESISGG
jgi:hypothetical protein